MSAYQPSEFLCYCATVAFRIITAYFCMQEGNVGFPLRQWLGRRVSRLNLPEGATYPLYDCLVCMSSIWGFWWVLLDSLYSWRVINPIPVILVTCGMLVIVSRFVEPKIHDDGTSS